jgi:hypothetical protein
VEVKETGVQIEVDSKIMRGSLRVLHGCLTCAWDRRGWTARELFRTLPRGIARSAAPEGWDEWSKRICLSRMR